MWIFRSRHAEGLVAPALALGLVVTGLAFEAEPAEKVRITFTEGGPAVVVVAAMEKGFLKAEGLEYEPKPMRAGVEGIESVTQGVMDFGLVHIAPIIATAARKLPLKVVAVNDYGTQFVVVVPPADKTSKTMADLKGKRVAWVVGAPSHNQNITALLAFASLTWSDVKRVDFPGFGQAMDGIIGNQVDAAFSSSISGLAYKVEASPRGLQYPIMAHKDKAGWARMNKVAPFFIPFMGTEGAGMSKDKPVEGATYPYPVLMTYVSANADLVYNMTRAMVELYDDYKAGAPGNNGWALDRQRFDWVVPLHDGAIKYFKEIGKWNANLQKHNDGLIKRQQVMAAAWDATKKSAPADDAGFAKAWMKARADALKKAGMEPVTTEW